MTSTTRATLARRVVAEGLGTLVLVAAVIGSGIAAQRLSPTDVGLQLLENSIATGAVLIALIIALHPVSAAFNPVITIIECARRTISAGTGAALVGAQLVGGFLGAILADLMFGRAAISIATTERFGPGLWLAEVVATAGLVMIVAGAASTGRPELTAVAVGAYISAAYWFTSSTSFANPAMTIARMFSDSFAGISPISVPPFLLAQAIGGAAGGLLTRWLHPGEPVLDVS